MTTWTLALDESGCFETTERVARILGGVLCPGESDALRARWETPFRATCQRLDVGYPPHANALVPAKKSELLSESVRMLESEGGLWLFVVETAPADRHGASDLAAYARMLGETVDIASRLAGLHGARQLAVHPARRSPPLPDRDEKEVLDAGFDIVEKRMRVFAKGEVRQAFDALAREENGLLPPRPGLASVSVDVATYGGAHVALFLADTGCNHIYAQIRERPEASLNDLLEAILPGGRVLVLPRHGIRPLRQLERALHRETPDLVEAARLVAWFEGQARGDATSLSTLRAARECSAHVARMIWDHGVELLARNQVKPESLKGVIRMLAGHAEALAGIKTGAYEGLWLALDSGWSGTGPLATRARSETTDRELAAKLWRLVMEIANHRGDVRSAEAARRACEEVLQGSISLALLAERLIVRNLAVVADQNRLPYVPGPENAILDLLERDATALVEAADHAGSVLELACEAVPVPEREVSRAEAALWKAAGVEPVWPLPNPERGRLYGTASRSLAFVGRLDEARVLALRARTLFCDPFNLRFNSSVLARIELERCRLLPGSDRSLLDAALEVLDWERQLKPADARAAIRRDPAARFLLDVTLRALLWATDDSVLPERWNVALAGSGADSLFALLSSGELRSHPSELIARHAGEVARRACDEAAAQRWFRLSIQLSLQSTEGTLPRFAPFTERLASSREFRSEGPHASVLNPSFEYR